MTLYLGDKQIAGTLKGEINNPYSLLESKYSELEITNSSWLKSNGQWNSKAMYPSVWEKILSLQKTLFYVWLDENDLLSDDKYHTFGTLTTNPKVGDKVYQVIEGDIDEVYYNVGDLRGEILEIIGNQYKIRDYASTIGYTPIITRHNEKDVVIPFAKKSTETYTDYDFVIDETNETFRLPLKNGSEDLPSDRYDNLTLGASGSTYIAPANGWYSLFKIASATNQYVVLTNMNRDLRDNPITTISNGGLSAFVPCNKGDEIKVEYTAGGALRYFKFIYAKGNGNLYYYVGDTVQNASLIDVAQVTSALSNKVDINSDVIDGQWVGKYLLANNSTAIGTYTVDLRNYLPDDGYDYEVQCHLYLSRSDNSGTNTQLRLFDKFGDVNVNSNGCLEAHADGSNFQQSAQCGIAIVGTNRQIYKKIETYKPATADLHITAYRRIGTNE